MRKKRLLCLPVVSAAISLHAASVFAVQYQFTKIADVNPFGDIIGPGLDGAAINAAGTVAFKASIGGVQGIYAGDGATIRTVAAVGSGGLSAVGGHPDINASGHVVYQATTAAGTSIVVNAGPSAVPIATPGAPSAVYDDFPVINDAGDVAFAGSTGNARSVYLYQNNAAARVIGDGDANFQLVARPRVDASGRVTFWGRETVPPSTVYYGIYRAGDAGAAPVIRRPVNPNFPLSQESSANANGQALFAEAGVFFEDGSTLHSPVGIYTEFEGVGSLSENGRVAYLLGRQAGPIGIYTGTDFSDLVVGVGTPLFGSTVSVLRLSSREALNDAGQIAFYAKLSDGRYVVARADSVPEPGMVLILPALGTLSLRRRRTPKRPLRSS